MDSTWLLLIYTLPSEPTRKRAHVWREVKKLGALYVRDGVCILPERPDTLAATRALAARIEGFDGQATVATAARLDAAAAETVIARFRSARSDEYAEVGRAAEQLLQHIASETEHRDFTVSELEEIEADVQKLKRWIDQVRARDYFPDGANLTADRLLERCYEALSTLPGTVAARHASA
ncbi:MAG TPA: Chromate resistance protein ChrB [Chloroflexota bacterium]